MCCGETIVTEISYIADDIGPRRRLDLNTEVGG